MQCMKRRTALIAAPLVLVPAFGWADAVHDYTGSNVRLHCPTAFRNSKGSSSDASLPGFTDYWFNAGLFGASLSKVRNMSGMGECLKCGLLYWTYFVTLFSVVTK